MQNNRFDFMADGGEMGSLMRAKDWSKTAVGSPETWPQSLKTMLGVILHSKFPMFIWWGPELICFYNDAYRPSLGNEGKHPGILGVPAAEAWVEIWDIIKPLIDQVLAGGDATWSEDQLIPIYRNGKIEDVYWTFSYSRINNDEGKPYGILVTCVETTTKVLNKQKLQEINELLQFSTDAADLGTWDYNPLNKKFKGNHRLKEWFGLDPEMEIELSNAISVLAEKDRERVTEAIAAALDYDRKADYNIEYSIVHPLSREERIVLAKGRPFFDENKIAYRFSGTLQDVTDQAIARQQIEEAEERARLAIDAANLGTFDFDIRADKAITSPRLFEIFDVPQGTPHREIIRNIHPDDRSIREEALKKASIDGQLVYEVRIMRKDNTVHWVRVEGKVLFDKENKPYRILGTALDFTQKKNSDQEREEYIAIASHELRNPLTSLKLSLDLLSVEMDETKKSLLLSKAKSKVKRIMSLTDELLNVSKIAAGILNLKPEIFNLQDSIRESIATFQAGEDKNYITITGTPDINIKADKFRIEQVLVNLISNASKYSPEGSSIIVNVTPDKDLVNVEVIDKGIGIDMEMLPDIFKKFSRIDNNVAGYGLGLYISDQIIQKHGGTMGVESEKGKGSVFWFTIPAR